MDQKSFLLTVFLLNLEWPENEKLDLKGNVTESCQMSILPFSTKTICQYGEIISEETLFSLLTWLLLTEFHSSVRTNSDFGTNTNTNSIRFLKMKRIRIRIVFILKIKTNTNTNSAIRS